MDPAYISAFAALAGTAIGGLTSFATSWMTQHAQTRAQQLAAEREARAYALKNRIRLISSPQVMEAAEAVTRVIVDAYLAPNITMEEMRANWIERNVDPLRDFSEACRQELQSLSWR